MNHRFKIDLSKLPQRDPQEAQKESQEMLKRWREADQNFKQICEKLGVVPPEMIC